MLWEPTQGLHDRVAFTPRYYYYRRFKLGDRHADDSRGPESGHLECGDGSHPLDRRFGAGQPRPGSDAQNITGPDFCYSLLVSLDMAD